MIVLKGRVLDGNGGAPIENKLLYGEIHGLKKDEDGLPAESAAGRSGSRGV